MVMRGGTSKGLFFHDGDLPADPAERDAVILAAYGSPDPYRLQMDGLGGATSLTSKVAVIGPGDGVTHDVTYTFGQVGIDTALIDRRGNCGNISSAVGPFAVDEGLVDLTEPVTQVRVLNTNTGTVIVAHVPVRDGRFDPTGAFELPGVPTPGAEIRLDYLDPAGAVTGSLLPTGRVADVLEVEGIGRLRVSLVDAANPLVFTRWDALGLTGHETPADIDGDADLLRRLEAVRSAAGVLAGISRSPGESTRTAPSVPKLALVGPPLDYRLSNGTEIRAGETDVRVMMLSMGRAHTSIALTGAACTSVATGITGTVVNQVARASIDDTSPLRIAHQAGVMEIGAQPRLDASGSWTVDSVSTVRTARRLLEGTVLVEPGLQHRPAS